MKNMPGFTAEAACDAVSMTQYRTTIGHFIAITSAVTPQLMIQQVPCWTYDKWGNGGWGICNNVVDDPGGWGIPPWIGDVACRQCRARCNKLRNPVQREDCLDSCPCD